MRRRRFLFLLAGCAVIALLTTLLWPRDREPQYQGKSLSAWLADLHNPSGPAESKAAEAALREIGTNALPYLMKWIRYEQPTLRRKLQYVAQRLPRTVSDSSLVYSFTGQKAVYRAQDAAGGFSILGSSARSAMPELAEIMADSNAREASSLAAEALAGIGNDALPTLVSALTNGRAMVRWQAAYYIGWMGERGSDVTAALPVLMRCVQDNDQLVAATAASALGRLQLEPEVTVSCLADALKDPRESVRKYAAESLVAFGSRSRPAVPALISALNDPSRWVRPSVTNALLEISPESPQKPVQEN